MIRILLLSILAAGITGCARDRQVQVHDARPLPEESREGPTEAPVEPEGVAGEVEPHEEAPPAGGRRARPGWCQEDSHCPEGQVCVDCAGQKECAPGCRTDEDCAEGERCTEVQCIRCPCPPQCGGGG